MNVQLGTWQFSFQQVKPTTAEVAATYDRMADRWSAKTRNLGFDRAYRGLIQDLYPRLLADVAQSGIGSGIEPDAGIPVLDCGVGTGAMSLALQQVATHKLHFHGVDVAPNMVLEARRRLAAVGVNLQTKVHDMRELPYPDNTFHLVMNAHTLEHLSDPQVGVQEMMRVVQPGGALLLVVTRPGLLGWLLDARWGLHLIVPDLLRQWLQAAGLVDIAFHRLGGPPWTRWLSFACTARKPLSP